MHFCNALLFSHCTPLSYSGAGGNLRCVLYDMPELGGVGMTHSCFVHTHTKHGYSVYVESVSPPRIYFCGWLQLLRCILYVICKKEQGQRIAYSRGTKQTSYCCTAVYQISPFFACRRDFFFFGFRPSSANCPPSLLLQQWNNTVAIQKNHPNNKEQQKGAAHMCNTSRSTQ